MAGGCSEKGVRPSYHDRDRRLSRLTYSESDWSGQPVDSARVVASETAVRGLNFTAGCALSGQVQISTEGNKILVATVRALILLDSSCIRCNPATTMFVAVKGPH